MDIKLDAQSEKLVQEEVETGRFPNAEAFVTTAVRHYLIAREFGEDYTPAEIEAKLSQSLADFENGKGIDGEAFFEQLGAKYKQK